MFCSTSNCILFALATVFLRHVALSFGSGLESLAVQNSPTYINISWVISAGSSWDYYTVDVMKISMRSVSGYPTNTTDRTHLITGLRPEEQYMISVTPWSAEGAGDPQTKNVTTEAIPEGEILVSKVTSSSAFLQWKAVEGASFYTIVVEPSNAVAHLGGIFETEVGLTILLPGTVFNVTLRDDAPTDLASKEIRSAPESPGNVSLVKVGTTEATLSWTSPTSPHDAYEFYVINNSTNERRLITTKQRNNGNNYEVTLTGLSPAVIYIFEVGSVLNPTDFFGLQKSDQNTNPTVYGRTGPEAPLNIVYDTSESSVTVTLTPPGSRHDGYEFFLYNSTTNRTSPIATIQRQDDMALTWTKSGLTSSTNYTLEVGTFLNAEGSFPLQRSDNNLMKTFQTGNAVAITMHYILLISALLAVFLV